MRQGAEGLLSVGRVRAKAGPAGGQLLVTQIQKGQVRYGPWGMLGLFRDARVSRLEVLLAQSE